MASLLNRAPLLKDYAMKSFCILSATFVISLCSCSQNSAVPKVSNKPAPNEIKVGGRCEGCEAIYESPVAFNQLKEADTLPDFNEAGPTIEISGVIYHRDGKTPAKDVVLYVYHTDQKGNYSTKGKDPSFRQDGWGKRHGYIRGWVKTDATGFYKFYTLVPASYPNSNNPKHIHPTIKEPGKSEYWIDDFVFDDDPLLPEEERKRTQPVGGSGVLKTEMKDGILKATRNIILGLNVAGYPAE